MMKIVMAYFENFAGCIGGLERILCNFSNAMVEKGHKVYIITNDEHDGKSYYYLMPSVKVINLCQIVGGERTLTLKQKMIRETFRLFGRKYVKVWKEQCKNGYIKKILPRILDRIHPDIIVSYNNETTGQLYRASIRFPYVTMLHNDPSILCKVMTKAEKKGFKSSKFLQVLTPKFIESIKIFFPESNIIYIPNEVTQYNYLHREFEKEHTIICVARLNKKQKRQDLLIQAFSKIANEYPAWNLKFFGIGDKKYTYELKNLIEKNGMKNRIFLMGQTQNIEQVYRDAEVFAFPSAFEGFGLALVEAMSAGLPCIGYKSATAVNEIIEDGENGILVNDGVDSLADGLSMLLRDSALRDRMGKYAHNYAKAYAPQNIWKKWEKVLLESANGN